MTIENEQRRIRGGYSGLSIELEAKETKEDQTGANMHWHENKCI